MQTFTSQAGACRYNPCEAGRAGEGLLSTTLTVSTSPGKIPDIIQGSFGLKVAGRHSGLTGILINRIKSRGYQLDQ